VTVYFFDSSIQQSFSCYQQLFTFQGLQLLLVRPFIYFMDAREVNNVSGDCPTNSSSADAISVGGDRPGSVRRIQHDGPSGAVFGRVGGYGVSAQAHFDDQLERSLAILNSIHQEYYAIYDRKHAVEHSSSPSSSMITNSNNNNNGNCSGSKLGTEMKVEAVLSRMKSQVLTGCCIVFSGVIPRNEVFPEHNFFWRLAKSLGAKVH
jgi:hypothetical protein